MEFVENNDNNTKISNTNKYIDYIRWAVFELACSGKIDHRNYSTTSAKSNLAKYVSQYANAEKAIEQVVKELCENADFKEQLAEYFELVGETNETKKPSKSNYEADEFDDDDEDDRSDVSSRKSSVASELAGDSTPHHSHYQPASPTTQLTRQRTHSPGTLEGADAGNGQYQFQYAR